MATVNESLVHAERSAKRFWISLVLVLFVIQSTILGLAIHLAVGDPSAVVVPDYHKAALNWDVTQRAHTSAGRLGWAIDLDVDDVSEEVNELVLHVSDDTGAGADGLTVSCKLYHHARAADITRLKLQPTGDGEYVALVSLERDGLWQAELVIEGAPEPMAKSITFKSGG